jgi:hypothetical protein
VDLHSFLKADHTEGVSMSGTATDAHPPNLPASDDPSFGAPAGCLYYRILFRGRISAGWLATLQNATLSTTRGRRGPETTLVGRVPDEAALLGVVNMVFDLGGELISIESKACDDEEETP